MSNPTITCSKCGRQRDCMSHLRADHPPTAAKKYLKRTCKMGGCTFEYRIGILFPDKPAKRLFDMTEGDDVSLLKDTKEKIQEIKDRD